MKRRIFSVFALLTALVTIATTLSVCVLYYGFYRETVKSGLQDECYALARSVEESQDVPELLRQVGYALGRNTRMTLVGTDGAVLFDSGLAASTLPNHGDREEFMPAREQGFGEATRHSDTLNADTYYYAVALENGSLLRLSRTMNSILDVFFGTVPLILLVLVLSLALSLLLASLLTKMILRPVNEAARQLEGMLTPGEYTEIKTYRELEPFIGKIRALQRQLEEYVRKLKAQKDTVGTITRNMREGLILMDREKNILAINRSAQEMLEIPGGMDYTGQNILHLTRSLQLQEALQKVLSENRGLSFDEEDILGGCHRFFVSPAQDESGQLDGIMVFIVDITSEKKAEQVRRDFAANVSHELKTPLTSINGFAEMIETGMLQSSDDIRASCARIHREGSRLIRLIDDIIRLSEIESGSAEEQVAPCSLREIVDEAIASTESPAREKGIKISVSGEDVMLYGRRPMLYELVYNLLDNAIKYNVPKGSVTLSLSQEEERALLQVSDTGIGVPPEHLERIFERFYRVDKSRSKQTGGTGLGLSIVKHIVEYHHGTISLTSKEGEGTTFTVVLPKNGK